MSSEPDEAGKAMTPAEWASLIDTSSLFGVSRAPGARKRRTPATEASAPAVPEPDEDPMQDVFADAPPTEPQAEPVEAAEPVRSSVTIGARVDVEPSTDARPAMVWSTSPDEASRAWFAGQPGAVLWADGLCTTRFPASASDPAPPAHRVTWTMSRGRAATVWEHVRAAWVEGVWFLVLQAGGAVLGQMVCSGKDDADEALESLGVPRALPSARGQWVIDRSGGWVALDDVAAHAVEDMAPPVADVPWDTDDEGFIDEF